MQGKTRCLIFCIMASCASEPPVEDGKEHVPNPPTGLTAVSNGLRRVRLNWSDNSGVETGFVIQRKSAAAPFATIATIPKDSALYAQTVDAVGPYTYRVGAENAHGTAFSDDASVVVGGTMTYALAPDDTASAAGIVIAGGVGVVLGKIYLTAADEDLKQTKMRISLATPANYTNLVAMSLFDGSTLVAGPVPVDSSGNADFSDVDFTVPSGSTKTLTVRADLNTISAGGAVSGADFTIVLDLSSSAPGTFEYVGLTSGKVTVSDGQDDVIGRQKVLRKTKPTVSLVPLSTPSIIQDRPQVIARFVVAADSAGDLRLKTFTVESQLNNIGSPAIAISDFVVREIGTASDIPLIQADAQGACSVAGVSTGTCRVRLTLFQESRVPAGTSKTYELWATISGVENVGESVSSRLLEEDFPYEPRFFTMTGPLEVAGTRLLDRTLGSQYAPRFVWSDGSAVPHNDADDGSADWTTGRYVSGLPSDFQLLVH